MSISNIKLVTQAIERLLKANLSGYTITRNQKLNTDPDQAAKSHAWIGIYRHSRNLEPLTLGSNNPWRTEIMIDIVVQAVSMHSPEAAEDKLDTAEAAVLQVLNNNKRLDSTVLMTLGYSLKYDTGGEGDMYFNTVVITVQTEVRE